MQESSTCPPPTSQMATPGVFAEGSPTPATGLASVRPKTEVTSRGQTESTRVQTPGIYNSYRVPRKLCSDYFALLVLISSVTAEKRTHPSLKSTRSPLQTPNYSSSSLLIGRSVKCSFLKLQFPSGCHGK